MQSRATQKYEHFYLCSIAPVANEISPFIPGFLQKKSNRGDCTSDEKSSRRLQ